MEHLNLNDQRAFPRIYKEISIEVKKLSSAPEETGETGITRNISGTGICLAVPVRFEPGILLSLKFTIPPDYKKSNFSRRSSESSLVIAGEVAWCRKSSQGGGYEIGVEFRPRNFAEAKKIYSVLYPYIAAKS